MDRDGFLAPPGVVPCSNCGTMLNPNGHRPAETYAGTATGECYRCQARPAFFTGTRHASGGEIWSHPAHCPNWRRDRELFTFWPGLAPHGCDHGRRWKSGTYMTGGSFTVQCVECWAEHAKHPATVEEDRASAARRAARQTWERRVIAEADRRLRLLGKKYDTVEESDPAWPPIRDAVLAEAPPAPEGEVVPEFPAGWGEIPKKGRKRKP
jgi:hypothetical protein